MASCIRSLALVSAIALALSFTGSIHAEPVSQEITEARQEAQIWTTYALSPYLRANDLSVEVHAGKATLTGVVADGVNRDLANQIALGVEGVTRVDNRITIEPDFVPEPDATRSYGEIIDDASVTAAVKSKLLWSQATDGLQINVTTTSGKVLLTGTADTAEARALAGRMAADTDGVHSVDNELRVVAPTDTLAANAGSIAADTGAGLADGWITTKVKSTFMYSSNVRGSDISVDTNSGVVTLSGKVDSGAERALAIELAQNVRGVRSVESSALVL